MPTLLPPSNGITFYSYYLDVWCCSKYNYMHGMYYTAIITKTSYFNNSTSNMCIGVT